MVAPEFDSSLKGTPHTRRDPADNLTDLVSAAALTNDGTPLGRC